MLCIPYCKVSFFAVLDDKIGNVFRELAGAALHPIPDHRQGAVGLKSVAVIALFFRCDAGCCISALTLQVGLGIME